MRQHARTDRSAGQSPCPVVTRGTRLREIAEAVALEDRMIVEPFESSDETEALVQNWFTTDAALAQRYVMSEDSGVLAERQAGRETIKAVITEALTTIQQYADSVLTANTSLIQAAGPCDGAIFVRGAVLSACEDASGPICEQARCQRVRLKISASLMPGSRYGKSRKHGLGLYPHLFNQQRMVNWEADAQLGTRG